MDLGEWLKGLGFEQYAQRFAGNDIDFALLTKLTDADLKELGVSSLGHRKRLLEAIAERAAAALSPTLAQPTLSGRMDPEDLREVISAYQRAVADAVPGRRRDVGGLLSPRARRSAAAECKILGAPRGQRPRPPLARPGQTGRSMRSACSGVRLVH